MKVPSIDLAGGVRIPQFGLGVFQVPPEQTIENVLHALSVGYRHIDTARIYRNEAQVGAALKQSGLKRDEVFVTTKLWNTDQTDPVGTLKGSLDLLDVDYLDLYLIHWPAPARGSYVEAWKGLVEAQQQGLTRAIGVSNFQVPHLRDIVDATGVTPAVNQIELHPYLTQRRLRREHADLGIVTQAWSPLAQGLVLDDPVITEIAEAHGRTAGQVVLRWHIELGHVVFPKSVTPSRVEENIDIFDFSLSAEEVARIEGLDRGHRTGLDPDTFS